MTALEGRSGAEAAKALARKVIAEFESFDYVVAPSGSCSGTIKTHVNSILDKLRVSTRTEAVTAALRRGIVQLD